MSKEILLNNFINKKSDKLDNVVSLNLEGNYKLIQNDTISDTIDMYEQYNKERDTSNKFRLSFTLYPIMTNILFNNITEIVYKEGSDKMDSLGKEPKDSFKSYGNYISNIPLTRINAVRNTEFSNPVHELSYHCGSDIFNNHFLKSKSFTPIIYRNGEKNEKNGYIYIAIDINKESDKKIPYSSKESITDIFNTLLDIQRDNNGNDLKTYSLKSNHLYDTDNEDNKKNMHIYGNYNTYSFQESFSYNIAEKDGWIGFINKTSLKEDFNKEEYEHYFINKCINSSDSCEFVDMYPDRTLFSFSPKRNQYKKRYEYNWNYCLTYPYKNDYSGNGFLTEGLNGLPLYRNVNNVIEKKEYTSANGIPMTMFMSVSKHNLRPNDIIFFKTENGDVLKSKVTSIGDLNLDDKEHYFSVKSIDFEDVDIEFTHFSKVIGGYECLYYFRKFKKLKYDDKVPNSSMKTLSFARNIYGEEMSQILYTDDINVEGLKDNIGRPLSEIYLTIVKNNKGYDKWYTDNPNYSSDDIEFSHAFGKISSGLYLTSEIKNKDYCSVCKQHNLPIKIEDLTINETSNRLEDDITINNEEFFGDLVEYSQNSATETVLEDVYYRFNTGQREYYNPESIYSVLFNDEIIEDDYDNGELKVLQLNTLKGFANVNPEGYMYKPHHKVIIREFENTVKQDSDIPIFTDKEIKQIDNKTISFIPNDMKFISDGTIINLFLNDDFSKKYEFVVKSINKDGIVADTNEPIEDSFTSPILFIKNMSIPYYAHMLKDGTCRYLWKDILKSSNLSTDNKLYDKPFTNGATYVNSDIIMPLRRQDPFGEYDLSLMKEGSKYNNFLNLSSKKFEKEIYEIEDENNDTTCW